MHAEDRTEVHLLRAKITQMQEAETKLAARLEYLNDFERSLSQREGEVKRAECENLDSKAELQSLAQRADLRDKLGRQMVRIGEISARLGVANKEVDQQKEVVDHLVRNWLGTAVTKGQAGSTPQPCWAPIFDVRQITFLDFTVFAPDAKTTAGSPEGAPIEDRNSEAECEPSCHGSDEGEQGGAVEFCGPDSPHDLDILSELSTDSRAVYEKAWGNLQEVLKKKLKAESKVYAHLRTLPVENGIFASTACRKTEDDQKDIPTPERILGTMPLLSMATWPFRHVKRIPAYYAAEKAAPYLLPGTILISCPSTTFKASSDSQQAPPRDLAQTLGKVVSDPRRTTVRVSRIIIDVR